MKFFILLCCLFGQIDAESLQAHQMVRRAAFDIGSGKIKIQVADVDLDTGRIERLLFADALTVLVREDLAVSPDGNLSSDMQNRMIEAIRQLRDQAEPFHPAATHGIATESMRLASNGRNLAERIRLETGVPITIVSQEEEGILGFLSAVRQADADLDRAVSWDFGAGSFQIATKYEGKYLVYQGKFGEVPLKNALLRIQGKESDSASPNPISASHLHQALHFIKDTIGEIPEGLRKKIADPDTVVLGIGINPVWGMHRGSVYDRDILLKALTARLDLDDPALTHLEAVDNKRTAPLYAVSNLILSYGVMEAFGIGAIHYVGGAPGGTTTGVLLTPEYWTDQSPRLDASLKNFLIAPK